jgi:hypothetical protein
MSRKLITPVDRLHGGRILENRNLQEDSEHTGQVSAGEGRVGCITIVFQPRRSRRLPVADDLTGMGQ